MLLRKTPLSKKLTSEDVEKKLKDVVRDFYSVLCLFIQIVSDFCVWRFGAFLLFIVVWDGERKTCLDGLGLFFCEVLGCPLFGILQFLCGKPTA